MTMDLYRARKAELVEALERVDEAELVRAWNWGADSGAMVYSMDEFNQCFEAVNPRRLACMIYYGSFNPDQDWYKYNAYGNLESAWRAVDLMTLEDLADYIMEKWDACELDDVTDLLAEWETVDELQPA